MGGHLWEAPHHCPWEGLHSHQQHPEEKRHREAPAGLCGPLLQTAPSRGEMQRGQTQTVRLQRLVTWGDEAGQTSWFPEEAAALPQEEGFCMVKNMLQGC